MLSLGVVIPTKDSMPYLQKHVEGLRCWLDLAQEVVVVDSFSRDGTVEYLRQHLKHPQVTYITHPPGLYASWNHGIAQITAKHVFIATAGDVISRAGIIHLVETAEGLNCDVVISKPRLQDQQGRTVEVAWPIDDIIASLGLAESRRLHQLEAVTFAVTHASGAMLGSCASNLFRTSVLKRFPFPNNFGTAGDGAWGLLHAAEVSWGVVPEKFSTFLIHPSNASAVEKRSYTEAPHADEVLQMAATAWRESGAVTDDELAQINWDKLSAALASYLVDKREFDRHRKAGMPWILNPRAWQTRLRRKHSFAHLHELKRKALNSLQRSPEATRMAPP